MNHAERKALKRAEKVQPTYKMTAAQIDQIKRDAYEAAAKEFRLELEKVKREATDRAIKAVAVIPLVVAHDKLGFGGIRLRRFLDWMMTWMHCIEDEPETLMELMHIVEEACGIKLILEE